MRFLDKEEKNKKLPFYLYQLNKKIRGLDNVDMLHVLPFYDECNILKTTKAFEKYGRT